MYYMLVAVYIHTVCICVYTIHAYTTRRYTYDLPVKANSFQYATLLFRYTRHLSYSGLQLVELMIYIGYFSRVTLELNDKIAPGLKHSLCLAKVRHKLIASCSSAEPETAGTLLRILAFGDELK